MYSQQELDDAVAAGVITARRPMRFARMSKVSGRRRLPDEEHFRLLTGFNDIFVSIAAAILLFAVGWIGQSIGQSTGLIIVDRATSARASLRRLRSPRRPGAWRCSSRRRRRMAFPRSCCCSPLSAASSRRRRSLLVADHRRGAVRRTIELLGGDRRRRRAAIAAGAAWVHWRRFHVPITVAAGAAAVAGLFLAIVIAIVQLGQTREDAKNLILGFVLLLGIGMFLFAMWWDASDRARVTRRSDVAFWLHLLAAPMIVHPVFTLLGLTDGTSRRRRRRCWWSRSTSLLGLTALAIDRRALLVSALAYVLFALHRAVQAVRRGRAQRRADRAGHRLGAADAVGLLAPGRGG